MPRRPDTATAPPLPDDLFIDPVTQASGAARTLSLTRSPMVRLGILANKYRQLTSRHFLAEFGVGAMDWRMLVVLTKSPGISAADISGLVGIDKAAVSRSLTKMRDQNLAVNQDSPTDRRILLWDLTPHGHEIHTTMLDASLRINRIVLAGLTEDEVDTLTGMLNRMVDNLDVLNEQLL